MSLVATFKSAEMQIFSLFRQARRRHIRPECTTAKAAEKIMRNCQFHEEFIQILPSLHRSRRRTQAVATASRFPPPARV